MARIRTIKPEFFTSEDIVSLSPMARLLYIALWCEADKEGRLQWKPATFKLRYFPGDNCKIDGLCGELTKGGLVVLYGPGYAVIPKFGLHQHINPRESASVLPAQGNERPALPKCITDDVRAAVMDRDGRACVRCASNEDLTLDHILPQSAGGPHIAENLRCLCRKCNSARPVAGDALVKDLALDGHTVESLRAKFGIDASARVGTRANQDYHAQVGREGKGILDDASPDGDGQEAPPLVLIPLNDGSDHGITASAVAEWSSSFPAVNVLQQLRQMRAWLVAKPERKKTPRGVNAFIVSWLSRAQDKGGSPRIDQQQGADFFDGVKC